MRNDPVFFAALGLLVCFSAAFVVKVLLSRANIFSPPAPALWRELRWLLIPLAILALLVAVGRRAAMSPAAAPPADPDALRVTCTPAGWTVDYPDGKQVSGTVRLPMGQPVTFQVAARTAPLDFSVPVLRRGARVRRGRETPVRVVFPTAGLYDVYCMEPGRDDPSQRVLALAPEAYERWRNAKSPEPAPGEGGPSTALAGGSNVLDRLGCRACHSPASAAVAPILEGLWGQRVSLQGGAEATVDEAYVRESLTNPGAKIVDGYAAIMPSYAGTLSAADTAELIAYLKNPGGGKKAAPSSPAPAPRPAAAGEAVLDRLACRACHAKGAGETAPALEDLWGHDVALEDGRRVTVDEAYVRESLEDPGAKIVAGYPAIMPSYAGRLSPEDLRLILEYLQSSRRE